MTASRDPDRLISDFLDEGDEYLQDQVYDAVRAQIERKRQRAFIGPWRMPIMNRIVTFGLGAAVVVVIGLFLGYRLLSSPTSNVGGPPVTASPTATPAPSVEPTANPSPTANFPSWYSTSESPTGAGILPAGSHTTQRFSPGFAFSVPEGWVAGGDSSDFFEMFQDTPANQAEFARSEILAQFMIMSVYPTPWFTCESLEDNRGATAAEMVAAASANEALAVSDSVDVSIGGLTGKQFDVRRNPNWAGTCPEDSDLPASVDPEDERTRVILLDVPGDGVLVVFLYSMSSAEHEAFLAEAMPIIESFQFSQ